MFSALTYLSFLCTGRIFELLSTSFFRMHNSYRLSSVSSDYKRDCRTSELLIVTQLFSMSLPSCLAFSVFCSAPFLFQLQYISVNMEFFSTSRSFHVMQYLTVAATLPQMSNVHILGQNSIFCMQLYISYFLYSYYLFQRYLNRFYILLQ